MNSSIIKRIMTRTNTDEATAFKVFIEMQIDFSECSYPELDAEIDFIYDDLRAIAYREYT